MTSRAPAAPVPESSSPDQGALRVSLGPRLGPLPAPDRLDRFGVPLPPQQWPNPVPTMYPGGAISIRGLEFTLEHYEGELVRLRARVRGVTEEACVADQCGPGLALVDREQDEEMFEVPALLVEGEMPAPGDTIELVARVSESPNFGLVLSVLALVESDPSAPGQDPRDPSWYAGLTPREVPALLIEGARPLSVVLADELEAALDAANQAALADDGQLAELHARRAVTLAPGDPETWTLLAAIYGGYAKFDHQLSVLAAGALSCPDVLELRFEWGQRAVEAGRSAEAIEALEPLVALAPESMAANFYLGAAHWIGDAPQLAGPYYAAVLALHERSPSASAEELLMIDTAAKRVAEVAGIAAPP